MKSTDIPENFRQLVVDECMNTYGGYIGQNPVFLPAAVVSQAGDRITSCLVDLYLKGSLFLNF